jgi:hypothetical protein
MLACMTSLVLPEALDRLVQIQRGILSASQARTAGLTADMVRSQLRSGRWQQMYHAVYAAFTGDPDRESRLWAVSLRAGRGALFSHYTAAELHGLAPQSWAAIHVTLPESRRITPIPGVVVHTARRADLIAHPTQLPARTRVEDTVLDLTQVAHTAEEACGWVVRGFGRRLTTQHKLADALHGRERVHFRAELTEILSPDFAGVLSLLEYRYVKRVEIPHGLPRGRRQARFRRGDHNEYRDVLYDDYGLVVELDGRIAHPGDTRWADIRRDNEAAADGKVTLRYGWDDLEVRSCETAQQVYRAMCRSGRSVPGKPCSPSCAVSR